MIRDVTYNRFNTMMETRDFDSRHIFALLQSDDSMVAEAIETALYGKHPHAWRSAWCLKHFLTEGNTALQQQLGALLDRVETASPDGYQRELLKLISLCTLSDDLLGRLTDICFSIWEQPRKQGSVRSEAYKTLVSIAAVYPELKPELVLIFDAYSDTFSHGIKHSLSRMRNQLEKEIKQNKTTELC